MHKIRTCTQRVSLLTTLANRFTEGRSEPDFLSDTRPSTISEHMYTGTYVWILLVFTHRPIRIWTNGILGFGHV